MKFKDQEFPEKGQSREVDYLETPDISSEDFFYFMEAIAKEVIPFYYEKNKKYKKASFQNGVYALLGNLFRQEDKIQRYKYLIFDWISRGAVPGEIDAPFGEDIWETIRDQMGYNFIGLAICSMYGMSPFDFEEMVQRGKESAISEPDEEVKSSVQKRSFWDKFLDLTVPQQDLAKSLEVVWHGSRDNEEFARSVWMTVKKVVKTMGTDKDIREISDILFLREDV